MAPLANFSRHSQQPLHWPYRGPEPGDNRPHGGKVVPLPEQIGVHRVRNRARQQKDIFQDLGALPLFVNLFELAQFHAEVSDDLLDRGACVQRPRVTAIEPQLRIQELRVEGLLRRLQQKRLVGCGALSKLNGGSILIRIHSATLSRIRRPPRPVGLAETHAPLAF